MAIGNGVVIRFLAETGDAVASIGKIESALGRTATSGEKFDAVSKKMAAGFAVVATAAAAFATAIAVDGVKAALEDEKSLASLNTTLGNMGFADMSEEVTESISSMQMLYGVSEDQLRPAFERLLRSTGDVKTAQNALDLALNTSAGAHKDLETVADALGKAYDGNTGALGRLGLGIDKSVLKTGSLQDITSTMSTMFAGQAATAAETYQGKINRLSIAADEAKEAIGYALLDAVDRLSDGIGGSDGFSQKITQAGEDTATFIYGLTDLIVRLENAVKVTEDSTDATKENTKANLNWIDAIIAAEDPTQILGNLIYVNGVQAEAAAVEQKQLAKAISGTVTSAVALGTKLPRIIDLTKEGGDAAFFAAKGYLAMYEAMVAQEKSQREYATTSGTVSSAIRDGVRAGAAPTAGMLANLREDLEKTAQTASSSSAKIAEVFPLNWRKASDAVNEQLDAMSVSIEGKSRIMSEKVNNAFSERLGAFKEILAEQSNAIITARKALDDYASSVTSTILGNINFQTTGKDAEGKTVPLSPEQIVAMVIGDITNQEKAVTAISQIATKIPEALAQKLIGLTASDPKGAIELANYLANNPAQLEQLNKNFNGLATFTETALGIPMATTFAKVGDESAVSMITNAKAKIAESADDFKDWVRRKLKTSISVDVTYNVVGGIPSGASLQARAAGGPVTAGSPYVVGEVGPELFIPSRSGSIVPNNALGGSTYNITVQAGVGDPRAIGQSLVELITKYERANGPVYAKAS